MFSVNKIVKIDKRKSNVTLSILCFVILMGSIVLYGVSNKQIKQYNTDNETLKNSMKILSEKQNNLQQQKNNLEDTSKKIDEEIQKLGK